MLLATGWSKGTWNCKYNATLAAENLLHSNCLCGGGARVRLADRERAFLREYISYHDHGRRREE